jgi:hypothetical protein
MAINGIGSMVLNPATDVSGDWGLSTGSDFYAILDIPDEGHYVSTTQNGRHIRMTQTDLNRNYDDIVSVQACISGYRGGRSGTHDVTVDIENASNVNYYSDTHSLTPNLGLPATYCSSAYTTSDGGSTAWTSNDMKYMRIYLQSDTGNAFGVNVYTAYVNVVYTVPPIPTYTSDDNVILKNGLTELKNGLTIIK